MVETIVWSGQHGTSGSLSSPVKMGNVKVKKEVVQLSEKGEEYEIRELGM
jgi:hypothetical protein